MSRTIGTKVNIPIYMLVNYEKGKKNFVIFT